MTYECLACFTTFKEEDGQYSRGWLVCPSCGYTDLKPTTEDKDEDNRDKTGQFLRRKQEVAG